MENEFSLMTLLVYLKKPQITQSTINTFANHYFGNKYVEQPNLDQHWFSNIIKQIDSIGIHKFQQKKIITGAWPTNNIPKHSNMINKKIQFYSLKYNHWFNGVIKKILTQNKAEITYSVNKKKDKITKVIKPGNKTLRWVNETGILTISEAYILNIVI